MSSLPTIDLTPHFTGLLLGTAVGDAIGLPREMLSRRRALRMFGDAPLKHRFILGRGVDSDDTEHTRMTTQALLRAGNDPHAFAQSPAWRLRWWFLGLPAGVGKATALACMRLWIAIPPNRSGVNSAGNGPAMRAAVIGAWAWNDHCLLRDLVGASTRLTHTHPQARDGALVVAFAGAYAIHCAAHRQPPTAQGYLLFAGRELAGTIFYETVIEIVRRINEGMTLEQYLQERDLHDGVSGYIDHTVRASLFVWLSSPTDVRPAVERVVLAGGDTDSTGAIVGALSGAAAGEAAIPREWLSRIVEWPCSVSWIKRLGATLSEASLDRSQRRPAVPLFWPGIPLRNLVFLCIVLMHGLRRLLPPY